MDNTTESMEIARFVLKNNHKSGDSDFKMNPPE